MRRLGRDAPKKREGMHVFMQEDVRFQARGGDEESKLPFPLVT
jgi:hypothetical protein